MNPTGSFYVSSAMVVVVVVSVFVCCFMCSFWLGTFQGVLMPLLGKFFWNNRFAVGW